MLYQIKPDLLKQELNLLRISYKLLHIKDSEDFLELLYSYRIDDNEKSSINYSLILDETDEEIELTSLCTDQIKKVLASETHWLKGVCNLSVKEIIITLALKEKVVRDNRIRDIFVTLI